MCAVCLRWLAVTNSGWDTLALHTALHCTDFSKSSTTPPANIQFYYTCLTCLPWSHLVYPSKIYHFFIRHQRFKSNLFVFSYCFKVSFGCWLWKLHLPKLSALTCKVSDKDMISISLSGVLFLWPKENTVETWLRS